MQTNIKNQKRNHMQPRKKHEKRRQRKTQTCSKVKLPYSKGSSHQLIDFIWDGL